MLSSDRATSFSDNENPCGTALLSIKPTKRVRPWDVFAKETLEIDENSPTAISLFSGCGGMDLGLMYGGFRLLWANDLDKDACSTYRKNIGEIAEGDILALGLPEVAEPLDLLTAGFPCQSFSNAGSRRGVDDARGQLYLTAIEATKKYLPKAVIFENVRGLLSVKDGDDLLIKIIAEELNRLGYNVCFKLISSDKHYVPQKRLRLIIVGTRKDVSTAEFTFPEEMSEEMDLSLGETILDVQPNTPNQNELVQLNPQAISLGAMIPEGGSWKSIPYEDLPQRWKKIHDNIERYRWPNFFRKFSRNEISGTITAAFRPENAGVWHPTLSRVFSVREVARIQSFPDWFVFDGRSIKSKYHQIGNAVPPRLAYELAVQLRKYLKGEKINGLTPALSLEEFLKRSKPLKASESGVYLK